MNLASLAVVLKTMSRPLVERQIASYQEISLSCRKRRHVGFVEAPAGYAFGRAMFKYKENF
jgi:hypothetical protein